MGYEYALNELVFLMGVEEAFHSIQFKSPDAKRKYCTEFGNHEKLGIKSLGFNETGTRDITSEEYNGFYRIDKIEVEATQEILEVVAEQKLGDSFSVAVSNMVR